MQNPARESGREVRVAWDSGRESILFSCFPGVSASLLFTFQFQRLNSHGLPPPVSPLELLLISSYPFNKMSGTVTEDSQDQVLADCTIKNDVEDEGSLKHMTDSDVGDENAVPSPEEEEEIVKKKYGGLLPKKPPLISKDHEHAFFDSADWALGKQGAQKPKGPLEALRPKLQPTPHYQGRSRRSAYAPADDGKEGNGYHSEDPEDESHKADDGSEKDLSSEEKSCPDESHDIPC